MSTFSQRQAADPAGKALFSKETWLIGEMPDPAGAGPAGPVRRGPLQWGLAAAQPRIARANASPRSR